MVFSPKIRAAQIDLEGLLVKDIKYAKFVGFDFVIGEDGIPYFLEANSMPLFNKQYNLIHGNELIETLLSIHGRDKKYGINVDILQKDATSSAGYEVNDLCKRLEILDIDFVTFSNRKLKLDEKGMYCVENSAQSGKRVKNRFDVLINRQPKARLFNKIPKARRLELAVISPPELAFVKNKNRTTKTILPYLPSPKNYLVKTWRTYRRRINQISESCPHGKDMPIGIIKPLKGSMERGIEFIYDKNRYARKIEQTYVLQEFIKPWTYKGRATEVRAFFVDGEASRGVVRTAAFQLNDSTVSDHLRFIPNQYGGLLTRLSEPANKALEPYILAAGYAIERAIQAKEANKML